MNEEFYGLSAAFDFSVSSSTKQNLNFVMAQLGGIEQAANNLSQTLDQRSLGNQIAQQMGDVRSSTRRANATLDDMGDTFKMAQKRLNPLKREFRALRKEVALVDFGEIGDDNTFRNATREVRRYVDALRNLESQIEGNTAADREFVATLKQQQRIMGTRISMQSSQRDAAKAQTRKGEFEFLRNTGEKLFNDQIVEKGRGAIDLYANFDDTMSAVKAITTATDEQEKRLRQRAEILGARTRFTAKEAAEAETYLGMAGFKTDAILGGLGSTLNLASAGQLDLAESADISSNILSGFMLKVEELGHATDVLARTATSANTNVQQLGVAMSYAAPSAKLYGATLEETSALIGVMSNAGIQADKAGTASRAAFIKLASPTKGGKAALAEFGISLTDTEGNMRNIIDVMNELNAKLQIDPTALQSLQAAGDNLEEIDKVAQSKQIQALKDIFGTTAISGVAAALGQINELNRLSLANLGSSSNTQQLVEYFKQVEGIKLNEGEDIFSAITRVAPDYSTAAQMIKQANLSLMQINLQSLNKLQANQLGQFLNVAPNEDILTSVIQKAPSAEVGLAQINSAMEYLGIEFKEKTSAAKIMATVMEDNLAGSFRALDSAIEAINLSLITPIAPAIRAIADAITKLSLFIANLPQPIQFVISSTAILTVGLGALATAIGAAGITLFGFQQALSVTNLASTSMAASLIPLTGFFETANKSFSATNSLESFLKNNRTLLNDFESAATSTFSETTIGLRSLSRQALRANQALLLLSRSVLLSPLSIFIGSAILLNALIEQVVPGVNLLGITLGAIAAPLGFIFGLVKGIAKAFLEFLGISSSGAFSAITPIFISIGNAIQMAAKSFDLFSQKGEELGESIGNAIVAPFIFAGTTITNIWIKTISKIRDTLRPLADFAQAIGRLLISALAENSPGPTYQIREKWTMTVEYLQGLFVRLKNAAILVNHAFMGIGDVSNDERALARQVIFQNAVTTIASLVKQLGILGTALTWIQTLEQTVTHAAVENLDLLGFTLLTLASLPMTLIGQLRKDAKYIVAELRFLIDSGIPKSIAYALPGLIAIAIANGTLAGFERGFAEFLDKLPARATRLAHAFYLLFDDNLKTVINDALSVGVTEFVRSMPKVFSNAQDFTFTFDFDKSYLEFESKLQRTLEFTVSYLKQVGDVANEIGANLQKALEPILSFQLGSIYPILDFLPPVIPFFTAILPMEKALVELSKSPSVKGLIGFFVGSVLPTAFQTIYAIANLVLYVFNVLVTIPVVAVVQELTKNWLTIAQLIQKYAPIIINFVKTQIAGAFYAVVNAIAALIARIPYIGEILSTVFLSGIQFLITVAPRYAQLLLRFFPIKQLLGLIEPYKRIVMQIAQGILYAFREGLAPFTKLLFKLLDPSAAFKLFKLYLNTGGFRQLIEPKMFGLFYINPFDLFFGGIPGFSKAMTIGMKIVSKTVWPSLLETAFPANIFTSKVTELMQSFADPLTKARMSRFGVMVQIADILEKTPELKIFVELLKGILLISPAIQIIGRVALTTMFWYSVLKPLNQEMLQAIANSELFGVSLAPVAAMLGAFRFLVVDGSDGLIAFSKQLVVTAKAIQSTFDMLSGIVGFTVHEVVGVSSILTNIFKATIGNLLLLIPIGITAALDATLIALQAVFKLMRVKTEQYGDAIVALLHGNIVPIITQISSDIFGVIAFAFNQTVVRVVKLGLSILSTITNIGKAVLEELIRFILDPVGEIIRLVNYLEKQFTRLVDTVMVFVKQLGLDRIISFAIKYWLQLGAIADVMLFILGIISPIQFAMSSLVAVAVFLVQEYQTGFQRLDAIIQALQHPIDFLTKALKVLVDFLGVYISPQLTEFLAGLTEQFVKNIPIITAGIFLIALVMKRNIGSAFMVVVDGVVGMVSTIREAIESIFLLGEKIRDIATAPSVQLFLGERSHQIRSRGTIGGFENPLSYSKDPQQQERAKFLAEQRIAKVRGAVNFQKIFEKEAKGYEKYKLKDLIRQAKSKDVQERNMVLGGKISRDDGFTYNAQPLLQEKKNRFGLKSYELTELGKSRVMDTITNARTGDNRFPRRYIADRSGLDLAYQQYDGLPGAPDELLKKLARPGSDVVPQIIDAFDKAMRNLHIREAEVDTLLVTRFSFPPSMPKDIPYSPEAFDRQVAKFKGAKNLTDDAENKLRNATPMSYLSTDLDDARRMRIGGTFADAGQMQMHLEEHSLKSAISAGLINTKDPQYTGAVMKLFSMARADETEYAKVKHEFMMEIARIQSLAMEAVIPDFKEFEAANRQAYNEAQRAIEGLPPVQTGLNALSDGVKRLSEQMVASVEETQGKRKNLFSALFGFTGVPQLIEQFQENRNLIRRIQETERRTNTLANAAKVDAEKARKLRERGLSNLMANSGFSYLEESSRQAFYASKQINQYQQEFIEQFIKNKNFKLDATKSVAFEEDVKNVVKIFTGITKLNPLKINSIEQVLKLRNEVFSKLSQEQQEILKRFLKYGVKDSDNPLGIVNSEIEKLLSGINSRLSSRKVKSSFGLSETDPDIEFKASDVMKLGYERGTIAGSVLSQIINAGNTELDLTASGSKNVFQGVEEAQDEGLNYKTIEKALGLGGVMPSLRQIKEVGLKNPFDQLKAIATDYVDKFVEQVQNFDTIVNRKIDSLESSLATSILGPTLASKIVDPIRSFYQGLTKSISDVYKQQTGLLQSRFIAARNAFLNLNVVSRINKAKNEYKESRANSLAGITSLGKQYKLVEDPQGNVDVNGKKYRNTGRPASRVEFQSRFLRDLQDQGKDAKLNRMDANKALLAVLGGSQTQDSVRKTLERQGLTPEAIDQAIAKVGNKAKYTVAEIMKIQGLNVDKIGKVLAETLTVDEKVVKGKLLNNDKFTAAMGAPLQWLLFKQVVPLIGDTIKDAAGLTFTGIGKLLSPIVKGIAKDVSLNFGELALRNLSTKIGGVARVINTSVFNFGSGIERLIGKNFLSDALHGFANFVGNQGKELTRFFSDQARLVSTERQKTVTSKIISATQAIFTAISSKLEQARVAINREQGLLPKLMSVFRGVRNFFASLLPKGQAKANPLRQEYDRLKQQRDNAQRNVENAPDRFARSQAQLGLNDAERRMREIGDQTFIPEQAFKKVGAKVLGGFNNFFANVAEDLAKKSQRTRTREVDITNRRVVDTTGRSSFDPTGYGEAPGIITEEGNYRSRMLSLRDSVLSFTDYATPKINEVFASLIGQGQKAATGIANYFQGAATRSQTAWENAEKALEGKNWPRWLKAAYKVGHALVNTLNHGAADVTAAAWERTRESATQDMNQMAQSAKATGEKISHSFVNNLGNSFGGIGKAGMAIGGALTAVGFAAQTVTFSLSNMGLISEETSQGLSKTFEIFTLISTVAGLAAPIFGAITSSLGAIGSVAATVTTGVAGIGGAIAGVVGLGELAFAPFLLGIAGVVAAVGLMYLAIKNNFLGIGSIAQSLGNTLIAPVRWIESAWQGFVDRFGGRLMPIIQPALDAAQGLINALNHSPTVRIPEAWEAMKERIAAVFGWMWETAKSIGSGIIGFLASPLQLLFPAKKTEQKKQSLVPQQASEFVTKNVLNPVQSGEKFLSDGVAKLVSLLSPLFQSLTKSFNLLGGKIDVQSEILERQLRIHQFQMAQSAFRSVSNRDRNKRWYEGFSKTQKGQQIKQKVRENPLIQSLQSGAMGKQLGKFGTVVNFLLGISGGSLLPIITAIGSITAAVGLMAFAFQTDFLGIRTISENTVKHLINAWQGFVDWFANIPLVSFALSIATGLINALNHNPTIVIPASWQGATDSISGMLEGLVGVAQSVGGAISNFFAPVGNAIAGFFSPITNLFTPKGQPVATSVQSKQVLQPPAPQEDRLNVVAFAFYEKAIGYLFSLVTKAALLVGAVTLFKEQSTKDAAKIVETINEKGVGGTKGGLGFVTDPLVFALMGKALSVGMGGFKLTKIVMSFKQLVEEMIKPLEQIAKKLNIVGERDWGDFSEIESPIPVGKSSRLPKQQHHGDNKTQDLAKNSVGVASGIGKKMRPLMPYLPLLGLINEELSMASLALISLSYATDEFAGKFILFKQFLPLFGGLSAAFGVFFLFLEAATKQTNILGTVIGSIVFVLKVFQGLYTGFIKAITEAGNPFKDYYDDVVATINRLASAGETFGEDIGYYLGSKPIKFIATAWQGFVDWFENIPLVSFALSIATGLINALNHNPTVAIPASWLSAVGLIKDSLFGLLSPAVAIATKLINIFNPGNLFANFKDAIVGTFEVLLGYGQEIKDNLGEALNLKRKPQKTGSFVDEMILDKKKLPNARKASDKVEKFALYTNFLNDVAELGGIEIPDFLEPLLKGTTIIGALGDFTTEILPAMLSKLSSLKISFLSFVPAIGAVGAGFAVLSFAWSNNLLGIRDITQSTVDWIVSAWTGFFDWFSKIPLIEIGVKWGIGLINALNHSPTVQIPASWQGATDSISGMLQGLLGVAQSVGGAITNFFAPVGNAIAGFFSPVGEFFSNKKMVLENAVSETKGKVVEAKNATVDTVKTSYALFVQSANNISVMTELLDNLVSYAGFFQDLLKGILATNADISRDQQIIANNIVDFVRKFPDPKPVIENKPTPVPLAKTSGNTVVDYRRKQKMIDDKKDSEEGNTFLKAVTFGALGKGEKEKRLDAISQDLGQVEPPKKYAWFRGGDRYQAEIQRQINEQEQLIADQIIQGSKSDSLYTRSKYQNLVSTVGEGENQRTVLNQAGQIEIQKKLAKMALGQSGIFSQDNLQSVAQSKGFKPKDGDLLGSALKYQDAISATVDTLKTEIPADAPDVVQLKLLVGIGNQVVQALENSFHQLKSSVIYLSFISELLKPQQVIPPTLTGGEPVPIDVKTNKKDAGNFFSRLFSSWSTSRVSQKAETKTLKALKGANTDLIEGAIASDKAWDKTTASIDQNINSLVAAAPGQGYELQKAVSEGSPGPTYWIREHWQKTTDAISGWLNQLTAKAQSAGESMNSSLSTAKPPEIDLTKVTASFVAIDDTLAKTQRGVIGAVAAFYEEIQDKYNTLKNAESIDIGQLFLPGIKQVGRSISILGGDIVDFAKRAATGLLTLNFGELADAASDFGGNLMYAIKGIATGFHGLSLSAIAFGLVSLTSISPVVLIMGGLLFVVAAVVANFLGARTIIKGLGKVGFGVAQALIVSFLGVRDMIRSVGQIIHGIIKGITTGDFTDLRLGIINLARVFYQTFEGLAHSLGTIFGGVKQILSGVVEGVEQIFAPLGEQLRKIGKFVDDTFTGLFQALSAFREGEAAGERFAEVLIGAIYKINNFIESIPPAIVAAFKSGFEQARIGVSQFLENVITRIQEFKLSLKDGISFNSLPNMFAGFRKQSDAEIDIILSRIAAIPGHIHAAIAEVSPDLAKDLEDWGKFFTGFIKRIEREIPPEMLLPLKEGISSVVAQSQKYLDKFVPDARNKLKELWQSLQVDSVGTILKITQDATNAFTEFVGSLSGHWAKLRKTLKSPSLLSVVFDELKAVGIRFMEFIDEVEGGWKLLADYIPGLPLFPEVFAELRNLGMAWILQVNTLQGEWLNFNQKIANSPFFDHAIASVVAFGQKFSQTIETLRNIQSVKEFTLLFIEQIDKAENAWNRFVGWLNTSDFMPKVWNRLESMGNDFVAFTQKIADEWEQLRVKFANFEILSGFFESLKKGTADITSFFENLQNKIAGSNIKVPGVGFVQDTITQLWYLTQRFEEFVQFAEQQWHKLSTYLANTELFPAFIKGLEVVGVLFVDTIGLIKRQWQPFTEFLANTDWFSKGFDDLRRMALGIPAIAEQIKSVFSDLPGSLNAAVEWIRGSWQGFVADFKAILAPIVDFALNIAQGLINALNHSPTIVIPESWRKAVEMITGFVGSLVDFAKGVATKLIDTFTHASESISNAWQQINPKFVEVIEILATKAKEVASVLALLFYEASGQIIVAWENIQSVIIQVSQKVQSFTQEVQLQEQVMQALTTSARVLGQVFDATFTAIVNVLKLTLPLAESLLSTLQTIGSIGVGAVKALFTPLSGLMKILWRITTVTSGFVVGFTSGFTSQVQPAIQAMLPHLGKLLKVIGRIAPVVAAIAGAATGIPVLLNGIQSLLSSLLSFNGIGLGLQEVFVAIGVSITGAVTVLSKMVGSFAEARDLGEAMGQAVGKAVGWVIQQITELIAVTAEIGDKLTAPLRFVDEKWRKVGDTIGNVWSKVTGRTKANANSTQQAWENTAESVQQDISEIANHAQIEGYEIQKAISEGSPGTTFWIRKMWDKTSGFVRDKIADIAQAGEFYGDKLKQSMSQGVGDQVVRDLRDYRAEQARVNEQVDAQTQQMSELGQAGRSALLSIGSVLSNFAPQLATPLFMLNDFVDAFFSLKEAVPALKSVLLANSAIAVSETVKANAAGGSAIVLVGSANAAGTAAAANAGVIGSSNSYIAATYTILGNAAQFAYSKIILPLVPFLPMIIGVAGGIFLLYQAFKNNFLGIADIVQGVGYVFREFFGQLFSGAWTIVANVFKTLETELFNIFRTIKDVGRIILQLFIPIFELLGIKSGGGRGGLLGSAISTLVNLILIPLRITAGILTAIIRSVSGFLQTLIKIGGAIINLILLPIRIVEAIIFGLFKGVRDATVLFSLALDNLLLKPALIAYDVFLQVSQGIAEIGLAITRFVLAPFNAVFQLVASLIYPTIEGLLRLFGAFSSIAGVVLLVATPAIAIAAFNLLATGISRIVGTIKLMWDTTFTTISAKVSNLVGQFKINSAEIITNLATNPAETVRKAWSDTLEEIQIKMRQVSSTAQQTGAAMIPQLTGTPEPKLLPGASELARPLLPPVSENPLKAPVGTVNPYLQALGLASMPTNEQELKIAYRQQAKMAHPDMGGSAEKFHAVNEAYESLKAQMAQGVVPEVSQESAPEKQITKMADKVLPKLRQFGQDVSTTFDSIGNSLTLISPELAAPFYFVGNAINTIESTVATFRDTFNTVFDFLNKIPALKAFFAAKKAAVVADAATTVSANTAITGSELALAASAQTSALTQVTGSVEASAASVAQAGVVGGANTFMSSTYAFLAGAAKAAYTSIIVPLIPFIPLILGVAVALGVMYVAFKNNFLGFGNLVNSVWGVVSGVFNTITGVIGNLFSVIGAIAGAIWKVLIAPFQILAQALVPVIKTLLEVVAIAGVLIAGFTFVVNVITLVGAAIAFITPILTTIAGVISTVVGFVTFVAPIVGAVIGAIATVGIPALLVAIAPFVTLLINIVAIAYAIKFAFQFAFGVIVGYIKGAGEIFSGVFGTLMEEIASIWKLITEIGKSLIEPFKPLVELFSGGKGSSFDFMGALIKTVVQGLLIPLRIVAFLLTAIIKSLALIIKVFVVIGAIIIKGFLLPLQGIISIAGAIKSVFNFVGKVLAEIGNKITNFLLAPFKYLWGLIQNISTAVSGFLSNVPIIGMFFKAPKDEKTQKFASGGLVSGVGQSTSTSDRIPAYLSHGEFVVNAQATSDNLRLLQAINEGKIPTFTPTPVSPPSLDLPRISDLESSSTGGQAIVIENLNFSMNVSLDVKDGQDVGSALQDFLEDPRFENAVKQALKNAIEKVK